MNNDSENEYRLKDEDNGQSAKKGYQASAAPVYIPGNYNTKPKKSIIGGFFRFIGKTISFLFFAFIVLMVIGLVTLFTEGMVNNEVIFQGDKLNQIAVIDLDGLIDMENSAKLKRMLNRAETKETVKGIIISVNSPGGMVVPSDMIAHDIAMFKQRCGKPVYVSVQQLSASGAYWATAACDKIFCQTNSMVGSIGVIYNSFVIKDTLDKIGIVPVVIKSSKSPHKDTGSMFRMPTEEEYYEIQFDINRVHDRFIDTVAAGRGLARDSVLEYATGDVFDGPEALEAGLVDEIGYLEDVIIALSDDLDIDTPEVIKIAPTPSLKEVLTRSQSALSNGVDLQKQYFKAATTPKVQAVWMGN